MTTATETSDTPKTAAELAAALASRTLKPGDAPVGWKPGTVESRLSAPLVGSKTYDKKNRTVDAVLATGYRVAKWYGLEELSMNATAINLQRVALGHVRLLDAHDRYSRGSVLGSLIDARVENGALIGTLKFGDTEQGRDIEGQVSRGELTGISVGYRINKLTLIETSDTAEDVYRADSWELLEVSIVSVPADPHSGVRAVESQPKGKAMADKPNTEVEAARAAEAEATRAAERTRVTEINAIARRAEMDTAVVDKAITDGVTVEVFARAALDAIHERQKKPGSNVSTEIVVDEGDTRRAGITEAIFNRLSEAGGVRDIKPSEIARRYMGMGLTEMAAEAIGYKGAIRTALQAHDVWTRAMHTTSDFPILLADGFNRRLLARYAVAAPTYRSWSGRYENPDFRPQKQLRMGDFPQLKEVPESGTIDFGTFGESAEALSVKSYAIAMGFSRQLLINDNLNGIDQVLGSSADSVGRWENKFMYDLLQSVGGLGPTLTTDTKAVFHADHKNLANPGTVLDVTNLSAAREGMMDHKTIDGLATTAFVPDVILIGPKMLTLVEQFLTTIVPHTVAEAVPQSLRQLRIVCDPNITDKAWYLVATSAPAFMSGLLSGFPAPRLSAENFFTQQGMRVKLEHDFGGGAVDYRGIYRNPGI